MPTQRTEYICKYCGKKEARTPNMGKPLPGVCTKNPKGHGKPHSWVVNRKYTV